MDRESKKLEEALNNKAQMESQMLALDGKAQKLSSENALMKKEMDIKDALLPTLKGMESNMEKNFGSLIQLNQEVRWVYCLSDVGFMK